ncbi:hypothetical protein [Rubrolithibacter danxiaensis]|uniref:hypothetical protein n=1 Tax=Rubrolithibacter danxiaensis TaxID=3390805 RepID=UPI003BF7C331
MSTANQLNSIIDRTQQLIELSKTLQEENALLKQENKSLKALAESGKARVEELEEKLKVVKLARSLEGANEKTLDIKQKINEFVREIDKCIVLLKK